VENKARHQQPFCAIANFVQAARFSFARVIILAERTRLRSSQPTSSGETLYVIRKKIAVKFGALPFFGNLAKNLNLWDAILQYL